MFRLIIILLIVGGISLGFIYLLQDQESKQKLGFNINEEDINPESLGDIFEEKKDDNDIYNQNNNLNNKKNSMEEIKDFHPEEDNVLQEGKNYGALIKTSAGDILVDLNEQDVPITVNNFVYLANTGFYANTPFHRVMEGFMIQGGDPTGTGSGGPGYKFKDEEFQGEYTRGTLAMANAGPDTNGSQFFIMHADQALPPNYTIFGKVLKGMETVDKIATAEVTTNMMGEPSTPVEPVVIESVQVIAE